MDDRQLDFFNDKAKVHASSHRILLRKISLLALSKIKGIGFQTLRKAIMLNEGIDSVWQLTDSELHILAPKIPVAELNNIINTIRTNRDLLLNRAHNELNNFNKKGIDLIFLGDTNYPTYLSKINDPPLWLFVEGNSKLLLKDNMIAVVGTRAASDIGINNAKRISSILSKHKYPIVSGLAEGIDAVAHQTALDYGNDCIAVLGTGISIVFPASTAALRNRIINNSGLILSEYLPNDLYSKERFVQRNRIQAAISKAVIPIEWKQNGGTAHTIRFAEKYERPILLVNDVDNQNEKEGKSYYSNRRNTFIIDPKLDNIESELINLLYQLNIIGNSKYESIQTIPVLFQSVVNEFERILHNYDLSENDIENLLLEIKNKWNLKQASHGN